MNKSHIPVKLRICLIKEINVLFSISFPHWGDKHRTFLFYLMNFFF